jgi:hypothetical protein
VPTGGGVVPTGGGNVSSGNGRREVQRTEELDRHTEDLDRDTEDLDRRTEELISQLNATRGGAGSGEPSRSEADDELASEEFSVAAHLPEAPGPLP